MSAPEIHIEGAGVSVRNVGGKTIEMSIADFVERVGAKHDWGPGCGTLPVGVRHWIQRGTTVGLAIEIAPSARSVQWVADDSPAPYGDAAVYEKRYLSFPYVEILLVLHDGAQPQLFLLQGGGGFVDRGRAYFPAAFCRSRPRQCSRTSRETAFSIWR